VKGLNYQYLVFFFRLRKLEVKTLRPSESSSSKLGDDSALLKAQLAEVEARLKLK
jgi:hypothetical protein